MTVLVTGSVLPLVTAFPGQEGYTTPAAAKQALVVTVELVAPVELVEFSTVTLHVTVRPAPVGKSGGLHCDTLGAPVGAADAGRAARPPTTRNEMDATAPTAADTRALDRWRLLLPGHVIA